MFKKILLATDGSVSSETAMKLAFELGSTHGATVVGLYVIDPYPFIGISSINPMGYVTYMDSAKIHAAEVHQHFLELSQQIAPSVEIECLLLEGASASDGILQSSKEQHCDLIVLGSHGRGGLGRLMLGSVATKVVNESLIPVLIAR